MMTRRNGPARAGRHAMGVTACVLALLAPAGARAAARPEVDVALGGTTAVQGEPNEGGPSASLSVLWPIAGPLAFGVMLHADDAGSTVDSLRDAQGHGLPYGKIEQLHRATYGASWRTDVRLPARLGATPSLSMTWGYYRIQDDSHGTSLRTIGTSGGSIAALVRRPLGPHLALGAGARLHWLFNDFQRRIVEVSVQGAWR
jgi:hypothetical protein